MDAINTILYIYHTTIAQVLYWCACVSRLAKTCSAGTDGRIFCLLINRIVVAVLVVADCCRRARRLNTQPQVALRVSHVPRATTLTLQIATRASDRCCNCHTQSLGCKTRLRTCCDLLFDLTSYQPLTGARDLLFDPTTSFPATRKACDLLLDAT